MVIESGGNVGIGTTSPAEMLEIYNATSPAIQLNDGGDYQAIMRLAGNDLEIRGSSGTIEFFTGNNDGDSSTERMRISSGGVVGINTTSANGNMEISGSNGAELDLSSVKTSIGGTDPLGTIRFRSLDSNNSGVLGQIQTIMARPNAAHTTDITGETGEHTEMIFKLGDDTGSDISANMKETLRLRGDAGNFAATITPHGAYGLSITAETASTSSHDIVAITADSSAAVHTMYGDGSYRNTGGVRLQGSALSGSDTGISSSGSGGNLRFFVNGTQKSTLNTNGSYKHQGAGTDVGAELYKTATGSSANLLFTVTLNAASSLYHLVVCDIIIAHIGNANPRLISHYIWEIENHSGNSTPSVQTPVNLGGDDQSLTVAAPSDEVATFQINGQGSSTTNIGAFFRVVSGVTGVSSIA